MRKGLAGAQAMAHIIMPPQVIIGMPFMAAVMRLQYSMNMSADMSSINKCELGCAVDGHKQIEPAFSAAYLGDIDVEVAKR